MSKIGDQLFQNFKLTNTGEIPARLESAVYSEPEFDSDNEEEIELVNENFIFDAGMWACISEDGELKCGNDFLEIGDIICPGATFALQIFTGYNPNASRVPYEAMTISNLGIDLSFVAADQNLCNGSVPVTSNTEND